MVGGLSHGFVKQKKEKKEKGDFFFSYGRLDFILQYIWIHTVKKDSEEEEGFRSGFAFLWWLLSFNEKGRPFPIRQCHQFLSCKITSFFAPSFII
jgi:hypothetical protein